MSEPFNNLLGFGAANDRRRISAALGAPMPSYAEWIKSALNNRDTGSDFIGGRDFRPPATDEKIDYPVRQDEVSAAPEPVWPPRSWWDEKGIMPSYQDRVGATEAFFGKALDLWGIPSAAVSRFSPSTSNALNEIQAEHPTASMAGSLAGVVFGMPALRTAGNALAARGHGTISQGAADATTAVGLGLLGDAIKGDLPTGMNTHVAASHAAPVAMANRVFMPNLPDSIFKRGAIGAGVGMMTAMPDVAMGRYGTLPINAMLGAAMAVGGKPNVNQNPYSYYKNDMTHDKMRDRFRDVNLGLAGAIGTGSLIGSQYDKQQPDIPLTTPGAIEWEMTRHLPDYAMYPQPRPYVAEEWNNLEPRYPPQYSNFGWDR